MPAALAAVGAWAAAHVGTVIMLAFSVATMAIGYLTRPSIPTREQQEESRRGWLVNTCDNTIPLPLVYRVSWGSHFLSL